MKNYKKNWSNVRCHRLNVSRGFGLLEVLISITILITILGAAISMQISTSRGIISVRQDIVAYNLAQDVIETIRQDRDTVWLDDDFSTDFASFVNNKVTTNAPDIITSGNRQFTRTIFYDSTIIDKLGIVVEVT